MTDMKKSAWKQFHHFYIPAKYHYAPVPIMAMKNGSQFPSESFVVKVVDFNNKTTTQVMTIYSAT